MDHAALPKPLGSTPCNCAVVCPVPPELVVLPLVDVSQYDVVTVPLALLPISPPTLFWPVTTPVE